MKEEITEGGGEGPHVAVSIDTERELTTKSMPRMRDVDEIDVSSIALNVAASMEERLKKLDGRALEEARPNIWKVPYDIRRGDDADAYDPMFISIGPYHHGKPELRPMDDVKFLYVQRLLARDEQRNQLMYYANEILGRELEARRQYSDKFDDLSSEAFVEMMVLDGCFLVEYLLERAEGRSRMPLTANLWNEPMLRHDLLLLENQIPFFVLRLIHDCTSYTLHLKESSGKYTILDLALFYLYKNKIRTEMLPELQRNGEGIYHLLHLSYLGFNVGLEPRHKIATIVTPLSSITCALSLCDTKSPMSIFLFPLFKLRQTVTVAIITFFYVFVSFAEILFMWNKPSWYTSRRKVPERPRTVPTATDLQEAGVLLKKKDHVEEHGSMLDVTFRDGVLEIPLVTIQTSTNSKFRNLLAFEQGCPTVGNNFMSYLVLMDNLVNTAGDVALLKRMGILESKLGCDEDVARFFNSVRRGTSLSFDKHYLVGPFRDLNQYCNVDCNRWRAKLAHDYFGSPWTILSLLAAIAALVMTAIQTYYTM